MRGSGSERKGVGADQWLLRQTLQSRLRAALGDRESEHATSRQLQTSGEQLSIQLRTTRDALDDAQEKLLAVSGG